LRLTCTRTLRPIAVTEPTSHQFSPAARPPRAWWLRGVGLALALLVLVLAAGTAGFTLIEGWPMWDAFYMTITTVTTVGYREIHPLSRAGEVFNAGLIIAGVGTVLYTLSALMALLVEGELHDRWSQRRRDRMLSELDRHFIVCGYGRIGRIIAEEFRRQRVSFLVVEQDPHLAQTAVEAGLMAVSADATNEDTLKRVRIERARGLIAAVGTDAENVYIVLTARLLEPDLFIISRAETEDARRKLLRAGADRVISPYQIGAVQLAQTALRPAVVDFVQLATSSENLDLTMEQVRLVEGSDLVGRSVVDANLRQRFQAIVVAIQRADGRMEFNPSSDTVMNGGDQLVVLGPPDSLRQLEALAGAAV
jgi:voltage-gated potassium channel